MSPLTPVTEARLQRAEDDLRRELDQRAETIERRLAEMEARMMTSQEARWVAHGRLHEDDRAASEKLALLLDQLGDWRAEVRGTLAVLKWMLMIATGVTVPTLVALVSKLIWG